MEMNNKPLSLLTIKGGSSSIKFALYPTGEPLERRFYGKVGRTGLSDIDFDELFTKDIPVIDRNKNEVKVKVGNTPHPMEEKHYVEWIEIIDGDKYSREFLKPGQAPEAVFESKSAPLVAREYCNIHGLWKG